MGTEGWDVTPPVGWEPVAEICRSLYLERDELTLHINSRIQGEIEEFWPAGSVIAGSDLRWSTGTGVANFLRGVAECRVADEADLAFQRDVGRRSAVRGLPLEPLIASFQVGFRELWSTLARLATRSEGAVATLLLERGSIVWERLVAVTTAVTEGYKAELARRVAFETAATAQLIDALAKDPLSEEARALATEIGFEPDGGFRVVALGGAVAVGDAARDVATRVQATGAIASAAQHGRVGVVIAQGAGVVDDAVLLDGTLEAALGVGTEAPGLDGARASMREAERALAVAAARGGVSRFEDDWLIAVLFSERDSVERILGLGLDAVRTKPHLVAAVRSFASTGFSVAEGARRLVISANSMRYRLTRWRDLTGWDPWTFRGLSRSLIAIELGTSERAY
jgi:hypothetical protein